jgi:hypothetical protein
MITEKLEDLRQIVADEGTNITTRQVAAARYVTELVAAVPVPSDDDEQVIKLRTAPPANHDPGFRRIWNESHGWSHDGPTVAQAKKYVRERRQFRAVLGIVTDESAHRLEKLAACQHILDTLHPRNFLRMNNFTPEKMLEKVLSPDAKKTIYMGEKVPVERPPQTMADVW